MKIKKPQTKSAKVIALLERGKGATLEEMSKDTSWQSHSVRAFLTGLRKKGFVLVRERRGNNGTAYRIIGQSAKDVKATTA